jgi:hypothetical protein
MRTDRVANRRRARTGCAIEPAVLEVNGLSEFGVKVDVDRAYSRAPITGVTLAWWRKDGEEYRATHQERQRSKLGRMARLRGTVEAVEGLAIPTVGNHPGTGRAQGTQAGLQTHAPG